MLIWFNDSVYVTFAVCLPYSCKSSYKLNTKAPKSKWTWWCEATAKCPHSMKTVPTSPKIYRKHEAERFSVRLQSFWPILTAMNKPFLSLGAGKMLPAQGKCLSYSSKNHLSCSAPSQMGLFSRDLLRISTFSSPNLIWKQEKTTWACCSYCHIKKPLEITESDTLVPSNVW